MEFNFRFYQSENCILRDNVLQYYCPLALDLIEVGQHWISSQFCSRYHSESETPNDQILRPLLFKTELRDQLKVMISIHKKTQNCILERLAVTSSIDSFWCISLICFILTRFDSFNSNLHYTQSTYFGHESDLVMQVLQVWVLL